MEGYPASNAFPQTPTAPPPPPEVKVRTMRSDLDAMAKSGGGLPRFESIKVAGLSGNAGTSEPVPAGEPAPRGLSDGQDKKGGVIALIIIAALAIFGLIGYLIYRILPSAQK